MWKPLKPTSGKANVSYLISDNIYLYIAIAKDLLVLYVSVAMDYGLWTGIKFNLTIATGSSYSYSL